MAIDRDLLSGVTASLGIEVPDSAPELFDSYAARLLETNEKMNLTAITDRRGVTLKHFADSVSLLCACELPQGAAVLDVGTGAGFPGIPLLCCRPDLKVTLLDSTRKKLDFIAKTAQEIGLAPQTLHMRAEEAGRQEQYRERFDAVVSRAVASLNVLCEYCLPFVRVGGCLAAMKGARADEEIEQARSAITSLGGRLESVKTFKLADEGERSIVIIRKVSQTAPKYPRASGIIAKKPL